MSVDAKYAALITNILTHGKRVSPRNGDRIRLHGPDKIRFTTTPLVSVRLTAWKYALREMEWFLSGSNNINTLHPSVRHWWAPWADSTGQVLYNYSKQFRHFDGDVFRKGFDQLEAFVSGIREKPHSARHVMTTWHAEEMYSPKCPITNCHGTKIQAYVADGILDLEMDQRSVDTICGLPHNWIQYWAFLLWLAHRTGTRPGTFIWDGGDVHIYGRQDHLDMARRIVSVLDASTVTPQLVYSPSSVNFVAADFSLTGPYIPRITDSVEMIV